MDHTGENSSSLEPVDAGLEGGSSSRKRPRDGDADTEDADTEDDEAVQNAVAEHIGEIQDSSGLYEHCRTEEAALTANTTNMDDLKRKLKETKPRLRELKRLVRSDLDERRKIYQETICGDPGNLDVDLHTDMDTIGAVLICAIGINDNKYRQNLKNWWTTKALQQRRKKDLKELRSQTPVLTKQILKTLGILYDRDTELLEVLPESL